MNDVDVNEDDSDGAGDGTVCCSKYGTSVRVDDDLEDPTPDDPNPPVRYLSLFSLEE